MGGCSTDPFPVFIDKMMKITTERRVSRATAAHSETQGANVPSITKCCHAAPERRSAGRHGMARANLTLIFKDKVVTQRENNIMIFY